MDEFRKKLKRVKPVIRAREAQLNSEAMILANVRNEKKLVMQELKKFERAAGNLPSSKRHQKYL